MQLTSCILTNILTTYDFDYAKLEEMLQRGHEAAPFEEVGQRPKGEDVMNASILSGLTAAGVIAGAMALSSPSQAATVDLLFNLNLDGMSTGTCAGIVCATPLGTVTVTGDTTGSLDFSVVLAPDVSFSAGDSFWFDLSAGGNPIAFALEVPHVRNHRPGLLELGYPILDRKLYSGSGSRLPWALC